MIYEYDIGLEDLHRLDLAVAERFLMSLWLRHLSGTLLGLVCLLLIWDSVSNLRHPTQSHSFVGSLIALVVELIFLWLPISALWFSGWNLRRLLRRRLRDNPRLIGKRSLYIASQGLFETDHNALHDFGNMPNLDTYLLEHIFAFIEWSDLALVKDIPHYIIIFAKSWQGIIVPISGEPSAEVQSFRDALYENWQCAKTGESLPSKEGVWPPPPRMGG